MKLATLLPYKENYSPKFSGAVSIHVSNLYKYSKYKKEIFIYGSTNENKYLTPNYINFSVNTTFLTSNNKELAFWCIRQEQKFNVKCYFFWTKYAI